MRRRDFTDVDLRRLAEIAHGHDVGRKWVEWLSYGAEPPLEVFRVPEGDGADDALARAATDGGAVSQEDLAKFLASDCPDTTILEVAERISALEGGVPVVVVGWVAGGIVGWRDGEERHWHSSALRAEAIRKKIPNPLAPLMRAWQNRPAVVGLDKKRHAIIPNAVFRRPAQTELPGMPDQLDTGRPYEPGYLPGFETPAGPEPAWMLMLFDAAGAALTSGRGAYRPLRLGIEAMMQASPSERTHGAHVHVQVKDLRDCLWPNGWNPTRERVMLAQDIAALSRMTIVGEWKVDGRIYTHWFPVAIRAADLSDLLGWVLLDIKLPPRTG